MMIKNLFRDGGQQQGGENQEKGEFGEKGKTVKENPENLLIWRQWERTLGLAAGLPQKGESGVNDAERGVKRDGKSKTRGTFGCNRLSGGWLDWNGSLMEWSESRKSIRRKDTAVKERSTQRGRKSFGRPFLYWQRDAGGQEVVEQRIKQSAGLGRGQYEYRFAT